MKAAVLCVLGGVAVAGSALASGTGPTFVQIIPDGSSLEAGVYHLDLGEPDDAEAPRAWQGPIRIISNGETGCTVSDDVAIVEKPLGMMQGHLLYVTTYSGSQTEIYVVDASSCAIRWTSPSFVGTPRITAETLALPGRRLFRIGADGLPATQR